MMTVRGCGWADVAPRHLGSYFESRNLNLAALLARPGSLLNRIFGIFVCKHMLDINWRAGRGAVAD